MKLNENKRHTDFVRTEYAISATEGCINVTSDMAGDVALHDFGEAPFSAVEIAVDLVEYHQNVFHERTTCDRLDGFVEAARAVIGIEALINAHADGEVSLILLTTPNGVASKVVINNLTYYECPDDLADELMKVAANIILEATDEFIRVRLSNHWLVDSPVPIPGSPKKLVGINRVYFHESIMEHEEIREFCELAAEAVFTVLEEIDAMND